MLLNHSLSPLSLLPSLSLSDTYPDQSTMMEAAMKLVSTIASKSPVAVQGSKVNLNYSRDHTVDESLEYMVIVAMVIVKRG